MRKHEKRFSKISYEDPGKSEKLSADDINVTKQRETPEKLKSSEKSKLKNIHNMVAHIEKEEKSCTFSGYGIKAVLCFVTAFILNNNLICKRHVMVELRKSVGGIAMNASRRTCPFLLLISILVIPLFGGIDLSYAQSSTSLTGVYRFETREDFDNFWSGGGQPITETDGKVFTTDAMVGLAIRINDTQDEETITWKFIRPDGSLKSSSTLKYDLDTDCWLSLTSLGRWCGNPERPYLMNIGWISGTSITGEQPGVWTIEFLKNGVLVYSENFELAPRVLETISGNNQEALPGTTIAEPLTVKLLDFDGSGLSGSPVTFTITSQPKGTRGTGLTETYNDPPLGAEITSITVTTDADGIAEVYLELGNKPGPYTVSASSPDADTGSPQVFTEYASELTVGDMEMSAAGDIDLPGIADPFFIANFDDEGNIIVLKNDPIGELVNDGFDLNITLNAYPGKPSWNPLTEWKWQIKGLGGPTRGTSFADWSTTETITQEVRSPGPRYFGDHDLKLNFTFKDNKGSRINTQKEVVTLKLFFDKGTYPNYTNYDNDDLPNWFEFWKEDEVVPDMDYFTYNSSCNGYGYFITPNTLALGLKAPEENYPGGLEINGKHFGGQKGIDCVAVTVAHELFHKWVYENNQPGGLWDGWTHSDADGLPDDYEIEIGTDPTKKDTFDLAGLIGMPEYAEYGDQEYAAILAEEGKKGIYSKDWAFPGKQTVPTW